MPKRKRPTYEGDVNNRSLSLQKKQVADKLIYNKKLLHRALKTAKGFERQKLGKRLKKATEENQSEDVKKINGEIEALKGLSLDKTTETHLHHNLLKIKAFAESELLPDDVKRVEEKPLVGEGYKKTLHDITSRLVNMKPVKDTMSQIMSGMYIALGIPAPVLQKGKGKGKEPLKGILKDSTTPTKPKSTEEMVSDVAEVDGMRWGGFDSDQGLQKKRSELAHDDEIESSSGAELDDKTTSRYEALLGGSSDEESFDEEAYKANRPSRAPARQSLSLSHSPSPSQKDLDIQSSSSASPPPRKAPKIPKTIKDQPKASTFLPSLMSSYWSGSEESASDISDDERKPVRKNRPGQMARRAIWEKKFGTKANHITSGQAPAGQKKSDGWDAKRGATDGKRGGKKRSHGRDFSKVTGDNLMPVGERKGKNDDAGVLHPSWQAAKKAKMEQKKATFEGKKVVFD